MAEYKSVIDEFESLAELDSIEKSIKTRVVYYPDKERYGFFSNDGKQFSVPVVLFQHATLKSVIADFEEKGQLYDARKSDVPTCPRLVSSNAVLLKRLQDLGYPTVSTFVRFIGERLSSDQMSLLSNYVVRDTISKEGSKLKLRLKRNTNYYRQKAGVLAGLQDGGDWEFWGLNYVLDGSKCTLGHNINWEFIAHEKDLDEYIVFGATCVQDFFNVDGQVNAQLNLFRTRVLNEMLEYSFNMGVAQAYHFKIVKWQAFLIEWGISVGVIPNEPNVQRVLQTVKLFADANMLLPTGLQENVSRLLGSERIMGGLIGQFTKVNSKWAFLCGLGIFGNAYLDLTNKHQVETTFTKSVHVAGTTGMFGTLVQHDEFQRAFHISQGLNRLGFARGGSYMYSVLLLLNNIGSVVGYRNLIANLTEFERVMREGKLSFMYGGVDSEPYGVVYFLHGEDKWSSIKGRPHAYNEGVDFKALVGDLPFMGIDSRSEIGKIASTLVARVSSYDEELARQRENKPAEVKRHKIVFLEFLPVEVDKFDKLVTLPAYTRLLRAYKNGDYKRATGNTRDDFQSVKSWNSWLKHLEGRDMLFVVESKTFEPFNWYQVSMRTVAVFHTVFSQFVKAGYLEFAIGVNVCVELYTYCQASEDQKTILSELIDRVYELKDNGVELGSSKFYKFFMENQPLE